MSEGYDTFVDSVHNLSTNKMYNSCKNIQHYIRSHDSRYMIQILFNFVRNYIQVHNSVKSRETGYNNNSLVPNDVILFLERMHLIQVIEPIYARIYLYLTIIRVTSFEISIMFFKNVFMLVLQFKGYKNV